MSNESKPAPGGQFLVYQAEGGKLAFAFQLEPRYLGCYEVYGAGGLTTANTMSPLPPPVRRRPPSSFRSGPTL